jgi:hypothetical protein
LARRVETVLSNHSAAVSRVEHVMQKQTSTADRIQQTLNIQQQTAEEIRNANAHNAQLVEAVQRRTQSAEQQTESGVSQALFSALNTLQTSINNMKAPADAGERERNEKILTRTGSLRLQEMMSSVEDKVNTFLDKLNGVIESARAATRPQDAAEAPMGGLVGNTATATVRTGDMPELFHPFTQIIPPGVRLPREDDDGYRLTPHEALDRLRQDVAALPDDRKRTMTFRTFIHHTCPPLLFTEGHPDTTTYMHGMSYDLEQPSHYAVVALSHTAEMGQQVSPVLHALATKLGDLVMRKNQGQNRVVRELLDNILLLGAKRALVQSGGSKARGVARQLHAAEPGRPFLPPSMATRAPEAVHYEEYA